MELFFIGSCSRHASEHSFNSRAKAPDNRQEIPMGLGARKWLPFLVILSSEWAKVRVNDSNSWLGFHQHWQVSMGMSFGKANVSRVTCREVNVKGGVS